MVADVIFKHLPLGLLGLFGSHQQVRMSKPYQWFAGDKVKTY